MKKKHLLQIIIMFALVSMVAIFSNNVYAAEYSEMITVNGNDYSNPPFNHLQTFTLTKEAKVEFWVQSFGGTIKLKLKNSDGETLYDLQTTHGTADDPRTKSGKYWLKAGTYSIYAKNIASASKSGQMRYKMEINYKNATCAEPNDSFAEAKTISLNQKIDGVICNNDLKDFYRINLPENAYYELMVSIAASKNISIYNSDFERIKNYGISSSDYSTHTTYKKDLDCLKAGTYYVKIEDRGMPAGVDDYQFWIRPFDGYLKGATVTISTSSYTYDGSAKKPYVSKVLKNGKEVPRDGYVIVYGNNINAGKASVTVAGTGRYNGFAYAYFTIKPKSIDSYSFKLTTNKCLETGKKRCPTVSQSTLKRGTDYTVTYSNNLHTGLAKAIIKGKGNYTGTKTLKYKIIPKKLTGVTLLAYKKKLKVSWTRDAYVSGYQIQYTLNSDFKGGYVINVTGNTTVSKVLTNLTSKKKYYVRVRSYKVIDGTKEYGAWSTPKAMIVK